MHARPPPTERLLEPCYTLDEANQIFYRGKLTKRALCRAFKKCDLPLEKIGGKYFCTASDIDALRRALRRPQDHKETPTCRAEDSPPASDCERLEPIVEASGSFSMERRRLAQASARTMLRKLRKPSRPTSPKNTHRPAASTAQAISSLTK